MERQPGKILFLILAAATLVACFRPHLEPGGESFAPLSAEEAPAGRTAMAESSTEEPVPPNEEVLEPVRQVPLMENMMETIDALCQEPRPLGSQAEHWAGQLLHDRLAEYGYHTYFEDFAYNITRQTLSERYHQARALEGEGFLAAALPGQNADGESRNIIGSQPGEGQKEQILVLSAHYDSTSDSSGVVDNAAGVAVVLEVARVLAGEDLPFALRIVFFSGEEEILIGSRQHVFGMEQQEIGKIFGNITVDTLAYTGREKFAVLTPLTLPEEKGAALVEASAVAASLLADPRVQPEFRSRLLGDHMAFSAAGIDSVNFGQSMDAVYGIINSPADTYEFLEPPLLSSAAQLLTDAVERLAQQAQEH